MGHALANPVGILAVGDAYMPAGTFTAALANLGDASARGLPGTDAPGRNARAVAELTMAFALMLIRGVPGSSRYLIAGGRHGAAPAIRAVGAVVHESLKPQAAYDWFLGEPGRQAPPSP